MKYHTTASTIIISILVLLCFAVVSMLCILGLGISSPGLMIVEALSSLQGQDGRLSLSFDSMERNLYSIASTSFENPSRVLIVRSSFTSYANANLGIEKKSYSYPST